MALYSCCQCPSSSHESLPPHIWNNGIAMTCRGCGHAKKSRIRLDRATGGSDR